jgi:hypothetical protein
MRGAAYAVAAIAAVGIMIVIATRPADDTTETSSEPAVAESQAVENSEVLATTTPTAAEKQQLTLAVPEMHCEFACFPKIKETLEAEETVELVELGPQKEEGAIDNRQVIVTYKPGFDVDAAIALLDKEGFDDSELVQ